MKSEINLYDKDMNFIKTFQSVEECAEFFDKEKNYIHHNLKYRNKIRKDGKWYKIRRIIRDEKQEEIDRLKENIHTAIEDIFTLLRVLDANVKELNCTDEELKVINKYSYNSKEAKNDKNI